ncbi:hypothetical protein PHYBLDRAFT_72505 [Phycomyces blakesleeanus NRRL 1555(-)]|uniref:Helitron helicase-like domain-containing protein n=1 Tax=Phycomyces blakesleeanus (strain ATCC 8743b / DSM 1359 / FGSC 10004 / NBRC 33097 / NRRL 1555) TaxID=763407 RepID=A0A167LTG0_PHYB8|nr:hypothetical protein PHYBLDRAFT_72505 [Phycomyces blakesleeanus NRRL 1555(-)]OAD71064.1 hypothetical protein PHYBLDRAFT_72505 [Phycomyces blakesleeanus NRRL 1555(-)]|eukprot:XP_018289104.1 hypothetical protein PHYBLDRAFT_72505 [Phycomyces blakesleeanus NRRL 1555(-)]
MKFKELMKDLIKKKIFGKVQAFIYVIEFQKRGLSQAHILLIFHTDKSSDSVTKPLAYATVTKNMIHSLCDDKYNDKVCCMKNGKCEKKLPKKINNETIDNGNGYPLY